VSQASLGQVGPVAAAEPVLATRWAALLSLRDLAHLLNKVDAEGASDRAVRCGGPPLAHAAHKRLGST
jgi:hypothetical protein